MAQGIAASQLSDNDLRHELLQLKNKQHDIATDGTVHQQANHQARTAELEAEFVRRFGSHPDEAARHPEPAIDEAPQGFVPGIDGVQE